MILSIFTWPTQELEFFWGAGCKQRSLPLAQSKNLPTILFWEKTETFNRKQENVLKIVSTWVWLPNFEFHSQYQHHKSRKLSLGSHRILTELDFLKTQGLGVLTFKMINQNQPMRNFYIFPMSNSEGFQLQL